MAAKKDWYYPTGELPNGTAIGSTCIGYGDASYQRPIAKFVPKAFTSRMGGGPVQWLQFKKVSPCYNPEEWPKPRPGCCTEGDVLHSRNASCEEWKFVMGQGALVSDSKPHALPCGLPQ